MCGGSSSASANSVTIDTYGRSKPVTVALTDKTACLEVEKSSLDKVEKGSFIGTEGSQVWPQS